MSEDFLRPLVGFFAIIDPIGNVLAFEAVAGRSPLRTRLSIAALAVLVSFGMIALFVFAGDQMLELLGISQPSFQIAAGILLVLPAIRLVEQGEVFDSQFGGEAPSIDAAVVPLALPMLSGPGALALATSSSHQNGQVETLLAAGIVLAATFVVFSATAVLIRYVHPAALRAFARVVGVFLMAIAVDFVVSGWIDATGGP